MPTESSATRGGALTFAPNIPGVGTIGISITLYPDNYGVPGEPTITFTGQPLDPPHD